MNIHMKDSAEILVPVSGKISSWIFFGAQNLISSALFAYAFFFVSNDLGKLLSKVGHIVFFI